MPVKLMGGGEKEMVELGSESWLLVLCFQQKGITAKYPIVIFDIQLTK